MKNQSLLSRMTKRLLTAGCVVLLAACGGSGSSPAASQKTWGAATLIETSNLGAASNPRIAIDANGNAISVWSQSDGTRRNIWANRYTAGSGWGTAALIETDDAGHAHSPQIVFDAAGNAMAVWIQWDGARYSLMAKRYSASAGWGAVALIETNNASDAQFPRVAIDANGNAMAVWVQHDGANLGVWFNRYSASSSSWGTAALIESAPGPAQTPQIAIDANGNALAVWSQHDGTQFSIWANRYSVATGTWGSATLIETDSAGFAGDPQVAIDVNGNALAVWLQSDGTRRNIWAIRYTAASGWGTAALIETDNAGDVNNPQIAMDASGNALAVWEQDDGTRFNIWANRYTAGSGWGTAALIENDNAGHAGNPQVAFDTHGNALAVWGQWDGARYGIWSNRYTSGGGWGAAALIPADNAGDAFFPQIAIAPSGDALAVWQQSDGTRDNVWANRYR